MAILIRKQYEDALKEINKCNIHINQLRELLVARQDEQLDRFEGGVAGYDSVSVWEELKQHEARKNELLGYITNCEFAESETVDKVQIGSLCSVIRKDGKVNNLVFVESLINGQEYSSWTEGGETVRYISATSPMGKAIYGCSVGEEIDYVTPSKQVMTVIIDRVDNAAYLESTNQKEISLGTHPAMQ